MPEPDGVRATITFDIDVREELGELARGDRRTLSDEVNVLLKEAIEARKGKRK